VLLQHSIYVAIIFHRRVWHRALSLRYACIRSSSIILVPRLPLCQISSFAASIAELAHGENCVLDHSIAQLPSLFDAPGTEALALRNKTFLILCRILVTYKRRQRNTSPEISAGGTTVQMSITFHYGYTHDELISTSLLFLSHMLEKVADILQLAGWQAGGCALPPMSCLEMFVKN